MSINFYQKGYFNEITIMKAIAAFFITWFHFKWTVPDQFANFFIGGAIGNAIFFFCSGYLLKFKAEKYMGEWFVKKLVRLLPSLWVFMLFSLAVDTYTGQTAGFQWFNWVYPTPYWFINAIICFFLVSWIINKINKRKNILGGGLFHQFLFCMSYGIASLSTMTESVLMTENSNVGSISLQFFCGAII